MIPQPVNLVELIKKDKRLSPLEKNFLLTFAKKRNTELLTWCRVHGIDLIKARGIRDNLVARGWATVINTISGPNRLWIVFPEVENGV